MKQFAAAAAITMFLTVFAPVMGQAPSCKAGVHAPPVGFLSWAVGSRVAVYIVSADFDDNEIPLLLAPLSSWNAVSESTASKVKFEYKGTTAAPRYCENCLTIRRGPVFDKSKRHLTEIRAYSAAGDQIMTWGTIVIDPLVTNPKALTNAVAHELGHSFGLLDCYECKRDSTVMIKFKDINASHEIVGPSACDVTQVRAGYFKLATQRRKPHQLKRMVVDEEGEEPVEDDTPVVIPKPRGEEREPWE